MSKQTVEYKVINRVLNTLHYTIGDNQTVTWEGAMNILAADGWKLVSSVKMYDGNIEYTFERPVQTFEQTQLPFAQAMSDPVTFADMFESFFSSKKSADPIVQKDKDGSILITEGGQVLFKFNGYGSLIQSTILDDKSKLAQIEKSLDSMGAYSAAGTIRSLARSTR